MTKPLRPLAAALLLLPAAVFRPAPAEAAVYMAGPDAGLVREAPAIAVVRIESVDEGARPGGRIATRSTAVVESVLAGSLPRRIVVETPGGTDGTRRLFLPGVPRFGAGERAILMLEPAREAGVFRPFRMALGTFGVRRGASGEVELVRPLGGSLVLGPDLLPKPEPRRTAAGFLELIRRVRGGAPVTAEALSPGGDVDPNYLFFGVRWTEFENGSPVAIRTGVTPQAGVTDGGTPEVQDGISTWVGDSGSTILYQWAGTTSQTNGFTRSDDVNAVIFNDPNDEMGSFSCANGGVLAIGGAWGLSETTTVNGQSFNRIAECDIIFNDGLECFLGGAKGMLDMAEIATHELGHTLGLDHTGDSSATMYPYCHCDGRGPVIAADDRAAVAFLYPGVSIPPVAAFSVSPASPVVGESVSFQDTSSGDPTAYAWTFGDGGTSNEQNPTHSWASAGTYTVTLRASNGAGTSSATATVVVANPNRPPTPAFTATPTTPRVGQSVSFRDASTGGATSWSWTFGDGGTSSLQNPKHVFSSPGAMAVSLVVTNAFGSATARNTVVVSGEPVASFSVLPLAPQVGQTASFNDTSAGEPTSWTWQFGDGTTSSLRNPQHTYAAPGDFPVILLVKNASGSSTATRVVTVQTNEGAPAIGFAVRDTNGDAVLPGQSLRRGEPYSFIDTSTPATGATLSGSVWRFDDGSTDQGTSITRTFVSPAVSVRLTHEVSQTNGRIAYATASWPLEGDVPTPKLAAQLVPAGAHAPGVGGAFWRTDVIVHNATSAPLDASLAVYGSGRDNSGAPGVSATSGLAPGATAVLRDVFGDASQNPGGAASGALLLRPSSALSGRRPVVTSVTYTADPSNPGAGTYGQMIPSLPVMTTDGATTGSVLLEGLRSGGDFRTNVGAVNLSSRSTSLVLSAKSGAGGALLGTATLNLPPYGHLQVGIDGSNFPGFPGSDNFYVEVQPSSAALFRAYSSVVDNRTNDPSYVAARTAAVGTVTLPGAASAPGLNGTVWKSSLHLVNPGPADVGFSVSLTRRTSAGVSTIPRTVAVPKRSQVVLGDVVSQLFGLSNASGSIQVSGGPSISYVASLRTYNVASTGTFGQWIAGFPASSAATLSAPAIVPGLAVNGAFRTNVGLVNVSSLVAAVVRLEILDASGGVLAARDVTLSPGEWMQKELAVILGLPSGGVSGDSLVLRATPQGSAAAFAYGSVVDNVTGDPVYSAGITE